MKEDSSHGVRFGDLVTRGKIDSSDPLRKAVGNVFGNLGLKKLADKISPPDVEFTLTEHAPVEIKILEDTRETQDKLLGDLTIVSLSPDTSLTLRQSEGGGIENLAVSNTAIIRKMVGLVEQNYKLITGHEPNNQYLREGFSYADILRLVERWDIPMFLATTGPIDSRNQGHFVLPLKLPPTLENGNWQIPVFNSLHGGVESFIINDWQEVTRDSSALQRNLQQSRIYTFPTSQNILGRILDGHNYDLTSFPEDLNTTVSAKTTATQSGQGDLDCGLYCLCHAAMLCAVTNPRGLSRPINSEQMRKDFARAMDEDENNPEKGLKIASINELYEMLGIDELEVKID